MIAQELITGGCSRLAMVEAGNQLPNAAPFPARPPPPPPLLYPAHGVAFKESGSPTDSPTTSHMSRKFGKQADKCGDSNASDESDQQLTDRVQNKDVSFPTYSGSLIRDHQMLNMVILRFSSLIVLHWTI